MPKNRGGHSPCETSVASLRTLGGAARSDVEMGEGVVVHVVSGGVGDEGADFVDGDGFVVVGG
jgi:hypothetical protein